MFAKKHCIAVDGSALKKSKGSVFELDYNHEIVGRPCQLNQVVAGAQVQPCRGCKRYPCNLSITSFQYAFKQPPLSRTPRAERPCRLKLVENAVKRETLPRSPASA